MVDGFFITMDKDKMDMELLLSADPSLPQVARYLDTCYPFAGMVGNETAAVCLLEKKERFYDIVNLAVRADYQGKGLCKELLMYVLDFVRIHGGRYVETGCGNANIRLYASLQRAGFRVVGIWQDYFFQENRTPLVENCILNRDMIRFRVDLEEKTNSNR